MEFWTADGDRLPPGGYNCPDWVGDGKLWAANAERHP
eukprot:gene6219-48657_t